MQCIRYFFFLEFPLDVSELFICFLYKHFHLNFWLFLLMTTICGDCYYDIVYIWQIAKALQFIHSKGVAHLDVKPDNIYVKEGVYKLGDFGCATTTDKSLPVEEGDARYMPQEILNENYDNLDKVDIFSLGASIYELVKGSPLPESGPHFLHLREGKMPLLPGHSLQFQNLIKVRFSS